MNAQTPRTLKHAAEILQAVRDAIPGTDDLATLLPAVDAVGVWLAGRPMGKMVQKLSGEAHSLSDRLRGGSGKGGVRVGAVRSGNLDRFPIGTIVRLDIPGHVNKLAYVTGHEIRENASDAWRGEWLRVQPVFAGTYGYHHEGVEMLVRWCCVWAN